MLPKVQDQPQSRDLLFVALAREVAIDHLDTETILKLYSITPEDWQNIQTNARFQQLLEAEVLAWQSATNTAERTKLKAGAIIEFWLPEANERLHDKAENLPAKVELVKFLGKVAGFERVAGDGVGSGNGFSVTINMGAEKSIKFEKALLPPKVIEGDVL